MMSVKFNAESAMVLLSEMHRYCSSMERETKDLLKMVNDSNAWNDNQYKAFQNNINALKDDLNMALQQESQYMNIYLEKVKELRR